MSTRVLSLAAALAVAVAAPAAGQEPALDNHYIDSGEVFISRQEFTGGGWVYLAIARMLQEPSARTRGEGQFLVTGGGGGYQAGQTVWTRYYWRTRIAAQADVSLGKQIFVPDLSDNGIYRQPNDRQEAMNANWWTATITDLADMYKLQATAGGEYHVSLGAMRVVR